MADIAAMQAANQHSLSLGETIPYGEKAFREVELRYTISHNAVIAYLNFH